MDAGLRERSAPKLSFVESKEVAALELDHAVKRKGDSRRRAPSYSSNHHCLPHQHCTWWDCCALGTSCNTCPGGYQGEVAFGRCAFKGHFFCKPRHCSGSWGGWSTCSRQCGGGTKESHYTVAQEASTGGQGCPAQRIQVEACNQHACPVDCIGQWGSWASCSATCGDGTQEQTFMVSTAAQHGGAACPHQHGETRSQICSNQPCPVDCQGEWGAYGACSAPCGAGTQKRHFAISTPQQHGGAPCTSQNGQEQSQACTLQPCPVDCHGQWSEFGVCSSTCGNGTKSRSFTVVLPHQHDGVPCSNEDGQSDEQPCNQQACCPASTWHNGKNNKCYDTSSTFWWLTYPEADASCC